LCLPSLGESQTDRMNKRSIQMEPKPTAGQKFLRFGAFHEAFHLPKIFVFSCLLATASVAKQWHIDAVLGS
jgi:hypothetical protein